jgi:penicillin-binding protein 1A
VKEAILALRIERAFSKDQILELYLNEIFLGARSYGVAAAGLSYFDKSLDELSVAEAAFLAGLPKAPSSYDPRRNAGPARERRDYVIGRMAEDGYVSAAEADAARAEPLQVRDGQRTGDLAEAPFFAEEVRRQLVERFGEAGFYEGGLSVRTTVQPAMQALADKALRHGLAAYDRRTGWRGGAGRLEDAQLGGDWAAALRAKDVGFELGAWRRAVVLEAGRRRRCSGSRTASARTCRPRSWPGPGGPRPPGWPAATWCWSRRCRAAARAAAGASGWRSGSGRRSRGRRWRSTRTPAGCWR